jgi:ferredoxin-type protein NapH
MLIEILAEILKITVLAGLGIAGILAILIWKKGLATRVTYLRFVVQAIAFAAIFYIFSNPIPLLYVLAVIFIMPIVLGRFFCGWLCPFALYQDLITVFRKALGIRHRKLSDNLNGFLNRFRYVIFLFFFILPFVLYSIDPPPTLDFTIALALLLAGPFKPLSILLGPIIPLIVPWVGPLQVGAVNFSYPYVQEIIDYSTGINFFTGYLGQILAVVFVVLTVTGSFFLRRVWCRFCPTGSSIAIVNRLRGFKWAPVLHLEKDEEKCTKCGICKRVCPVQVTEVYKQKGGKIATSMCTLCIRCVEMCPYEGCLRVNIGQKTLFKSRNWLKPSESE